MMGNRRLCLILRGYVIIALAHEAGIEFSLEIHKMRGVVGKNIFGIIRSWSGIEIINPKVIVVDVPNFLCFRYILSKFRLIIKTSELKITISETESGHQCVHLFEACKCPIHSKNKGNDQKSHQNDRVILVETIGYSVKNYYQVPQLLREDQFGVLVKKNKTVWENLLK